MENVNESYAHKLAKQLLFEWLSDGEVILRDQKNIEYYFSDLHGEVEYEFFDDQQRYFFDLFFYDERFDTKIAVEILHTHAVEENKKNVCKKYDITLLEVKTKTILNRTNKPLYLKAKSYYTKLNNTYQNKLKLTRSEAYKRKVDLIQFNLEILNSNYIEMHYKTLYKKLKYCLKTLITFQNIALNSFTENGAFQNKDIIFFVGTRYLANLFGSTNHKTELNRISILCFLGLIEKVPLNHIPAHLYKKSQNLRKSKYHKIVNYYKIVRLDDEILKIAEERAEMLIKNGLGVKHFGRKYLEKYFGKEDADRVFPTYGNDRIKKLPEQVYSFIDNELLNAMGKSTYIIENDFINELYNKIYYTYGVKDKFETIIYLKKAMAKYDLKRERLNKKLKEKYNIDMDGYPFVIFKE